MGLFAEEGTLIAVPPVPPPVVAGIWLNAAFIFLNYSAMDVVLENIG